MGAKILHLSPAGKALDELVHMYQSGKIRGLVAVALLKNEDYAVFLSDSLSCIEKLGMIEAAKIDIIGTALEVI